MLWSFFRCGLVAVLFWASPRLARADPQPLSQQRSAHYYYLHVGLSLGALAATATEELASRHHGPGFDLARFGPDDAVRANFNQDAARLSDKLLLLTMTTPLFLQMSDGFDTSMGNASLIYTETQAFGLLLANTTKLIVRRPRPYTHSRDPGVRAFAAGEGSDAYASFYSSHASSAFSSAMAGSLLYAARTDELVARHAVWGFEFLMAGMTAQLRVRAGRHYRTDIWVGTLLGLTTGALVPALHGVDVKRVRGSEIATAGGALAVSLLLSEVVDFCGLLGGLPVFCGPHELAQRPARLGPALPAWVAAPVAIPGGAGLSFEGAW